MHLQLLFHSTDDIVTKEQTQPFVKKRSLRAGLHGSQVLSPKSPKIAQRLSAILAIESMKFGTHHFTRGLKSQVPSMTWMPTWQRFLEVRVGTCVESWVKQKTRPNF